nr:MarR family transcriptional regulator [Conexibacter arvalis]
MGPGFAAVAPAEHALPAEVVLNVLRTARLLTERLDPTLRSHGLTPSTFAALLVLFDQTAPLSPKEIGRRMRVPAQTLTSVIDGLERRGLVVRAPNPRDRRSVLVALAEPGRTLLLQAVAAVVPAEVELLREVARDDQERLIALLGLVQAACGDREQVDLTGGGDGAAPAR